MYARRGDYHRAIAYLEEALAVAQELGNPDTLSNAYYMLAGVLVDADRERPRALVLYETCLRIARQHGLVLVESMTLAALGNAYVACGDLRRAGELLPEALRIQRELHATMAAGWTLLYLGTLAYRQADYRSAQRHFIASLATTTEGGGQPIMPLALEGLAGVASAWHKPVCAARLLGAAEALRDTVGMALAPIERPTYDAICAAVRGQLAAAALHEAWQGGRTLSPAQAIAEAEAIRPADEADGEPNETMT